MKKPIFAGLVLVLLVIVKVSGAFSQPGHVIGSCPELKLWKSNALFLQAKDLYSRSQRTDLNNEWQKIVNQVDALDAEMTEFVRTCAELKARAEATNAKIDDLNRKFSDWNSRWAGRPYNASAMAQKNQLEAMGQQIISEQQARTNELNAMKAQRDVLDSKYQQLEQEVPRFISSLQAGGAFKHAGRPPESGDLPSPNARTQIPTQQNLQESKDLKEKGNQFSKNKQWQQAVDAYRAAQQKSPGDAELSRKYKLALKNLAAEQRQALEGTAVTGPSTQDLSLDRLKQVHHLNEQGSRHYENKQWQQAAEAYRKALEICPNSEENRESYALALDHLAAEQRHGGGGQGSVSAGKQLKSVAYHSKKALELRNEAASEEARKGFDTAGTGQGSLKEGGSVVDLSGAGKRPEWPATVYKDGQIKTLQKEQDSYKASYQQQEKELTQVRKEMETADPVKKSELAVKGAEIKEKMAKAEYNAALKEKEIRKRAKLLIDTREEGGQ